MSGATLATQDCIPCRGDLPPLSLAEAEALLADVTGWTLHDAGTRIERTIRFENFAAAFAFVEKVAAVSEAQKHHPDVSFGWGYATVSLQTHAIKGLHQNDFILAARIDGLLAPDVSAP